MRHSSPQAGVLRFFDGFTGEGASRGGYPSKPSLSSLCRYSLYLWTMTHIMVMYKNRRASCIFLTGNSVLELFSGLILVADEIEDHYSKRRNDI